MTAEGTAHGAYRHCGLDPQSRGAARDVREQANTTTIIPLSLDGRGIKGEGEQDKTTTYRHSRVGGNPQGGGEVESPSPLTAEDQSLSQCLTLGTEGENDASQHRHVVADLIRNPEGRQGDAGKQDKPTTPARHTGFRATSTGRR